MNILQTRISTLKHCWKILLPFLLLFSSPQFVFAVNPSSTNYKIQSYQFGGGGGEGTSTNYKTESIVGEVDNTQQSSTNFKIGGGLSYMLIANVPSAPTVTNPSNYYNKLQIVINNGNNPTDATFAIAVSPDAFATTTQYVQADHTLGSSPVWQDYSTWGSGSGFTLIGLTPGTTYTVKVTARQGNYTQSPFGPTASAATINPTFSFSLTTTSLSSPPFSVDIGTLTPGSVTTSSDAVNVSVSTNATSGAFVYVYGTNNGLLSSRTSYTISSASNNLSSVSEGYGARVTSVGQTSGGPMEKLSPYDQSGSTVGVLDTSKRIIFDSSNAPVNSGAGSFELKAKASATAPAASDYSDTVTVIATSSF